MMMLQEKHNGSRIHFDVTDGEIDADDSKESTHFMDENNSRTRIYGQSAIRYGPTTAS